MARCSVACKNYGVLSTIAILCAVTGCTQSEYELAPVSGRVLLDGQPLDGGKIMLAPVASGDSIKAGKPGFANIGDDGAFVLSTYSEGDGAVVAEHVVTVINTDPKSEAGRRLRADRVALPQRVTVSAGEANELNVELTSELINRYGMRF